MPKEELNLKSWKSPRFWNRVNSFDCWVNFYSIKPFKDPNIICSFSHYILLIFPTSIFTTEARMVQWLRWKNRCRKVAGSNLTYCMGFSGGKFTKFLDPFCWSALRCNWVPGVKAGEGELWTGSDLTPVLLAGVKESFATGPTTGNGHRR